MSGLVMQLFRTESSEQSDKIVPRAFHMVAGIGAIYVGLSVLCAILYGIVEMSPFDAVNHAMTTLATGGYSTHDASFGHFFRPATHWIGTLFMLAGGLPFVGYLRFVRGDSRALADDPQVRAVVGFLMVVVGSTGSWLALTRDIGIEEAFRLAAFNIVSVVTTTGYASTAYTLSGPGAVGTGLSRPRSRHRHERQRHGDHDVGPGLGPIIGPGGKFATLPDAAKWLLCLAMLLRRLEIFTVLLLFTPAFCRS